jgi:hypothetical protein
MHVEVGGGIQTRIIPFWLALLPAIFAASVFINCNNAGSVKTRSAGSLKHDLNGQSLAPAGLTNSQNGRLCNVGTSTVVNVDDVLIEETYANCICERRGLDHTFDADAPAIHFVFKILNRRGV